MLKRVANFATNMSAGPPNEASQTLVGFTVAQTSSTGGLTFTTAPAIDVHTGMLTYQPAPNSSGTATFNATLTDSGSNAAPSVNNSTQTFTITVNFVNDAPTFVLAASPVTNVNGGFQTVANFASGISVGPANETGLQSLVGFTLQQTSVTGSLTFSTAPTINVATGSLTFAPTNNTTGTATFQATLTDTGSNVSPNVNNTTKTFTITVAPINIPPSFVLAGNPPAVNEQAGLQTVTSFATNMSVGPPSEAATQTLVGFTVTQIGSTGGLTFSTAPAIDVNTGTLTYQPASGSNGTATFNATLTDSGSNNAPSVNNTTRSFTITVNAINQPPTFTLAGNPATVNENAGAQTVTNFATGISAGPANESSQTLTGFTVTQTGSAGGLTFTTQPAIDVHTGTLTYQAAPNTFGTATFSATLSDNGSNVAPNVNSSTQSFTITVTAVNQPPTFTLAGNPAAVNENAGAQTVPSFATGISAGPANEGSQTVTFSLAQTTSTGGLTFTAAPSIDPHTGALTYQPAANSNGTATFTATLTDSGSNVAPNVNNSSQSFTITVTAVNQPPTFTLAGNPPAVNEEAGLQTVNNFATGMSTGPANESSQSLVGFTVSQTGATGGLTFTTAPAIDVHTGALTYQPAPNSSGTATFSATLTDSGPGAAPNVNSSTQSFTITVNFVNDPPTFNLGVAPTVNENAGAQTVASFATGMSAGPANESSQTLIGFTVSQTSATGGLTFTTAPAIDVHTGTLTYQAAANSSGTATFSAVLADSGSNVAPSANTSSRTFTITVNFVNQAPSFTASNPPTVLQNNGPVVIPSWATYIAGAGNPAGEALLAYHVTNVSNPSLFSVAPAIDNTGKLTYTPAAGASGTSTIAVTVQDQGGTGNGGHDTSAAQNFTINVQGAPAPLTDQEISYTQATTVINLTPGSTYQLQQAGTPAWFLSQSHSFVFTGSYSQNYGGANEKWLKGTINQFKSPWYFIEPNGQVFAWDQTPSRASGAVVASLDPVYWYNPALLWEAAPGSYATVLQQTLGLSFTGNFYQNFNGYQERWLRGTGSAWYYITPSGKLFTGAGVFLATLDPIYYNEPARLYNAPALNQSVNIALSTGASPTLTVTPKNNFVGNWVINLITTFESVPTVNQFNVVVDNHLPAIAAVSTQTLSHTSGPNPLSVSVAATDADGDSLSYSASGGTQGYVLQTIYNLSSNGSYYANTLGLNEKWVKGLINAYNNPWYFILPNGQFYAWNGAKTGTAALQDPLHGNNPMVPLATLDQPTLYWAVPGLLVNNSANNDLTYNLQHTLGLHVSGSLSFNSNGYGESWLRDSAGAWYYIQANGQMYKWGGTKTQAQDLLLTTLPVLATDTSSMTIATRLATAQAGQFTVTLSGTAAKVAPAAAFLGDIWVLASVTDDAASPLNNRFAYQYFKTKVVA